MANTFNNTLSKVGNTIEAIFGSANRTPTNNNSNYPYTGQTCLEQFGMETRKKQLMRNEWKKDLQYTKPLVDAEYMIQTEFKVSSYEDRLMEQAEAKAEKQAEKKAKKAAREAAKEEKTKVKEERKEAIETIKRNNEYILSQIEESLKYMRNQKIN